MPGLAGSPAARIVSDFDRNMFHDFQSERFQPRARFGMVREQPEATQTKLAEDLPPDTELTVRRRFV